MNKAQAIQTFWSSFGIPAYDANTVPASAVMPYITYTMSEGALDEPVLVTASLWYHSTRWDEITTKAETISQFIRNIHTPLRVDNGYVWVTAGTPFAQRMSDPNDMVRRIVINVTVEFLTKY